MQRGAGPLIIRVNMISLELERGGSSSQFSQVCERKRERRREKERGERVGVREGEKTVSVYVRCHEAAV